jgi:hypothetical protein
MKTPIQNFESHMAAYCESKGFAPNSKHELWQSCMSRFETYSDAFKSVMPYKFFVENVINEKPKAEMHPIFSQLLKPFGIQ